MDYLDKLTQLAQVRGEINIRCLFQGDWQVEHQPDTAEYQGCLLYTSLTLQRSNPLFSKEGLGEIWQK